MLVFISRFPLLVFSRLCVGASVFLMLLARAVFPVEIRVIVQGGLWLGCISCRTLDGDEYGGL